MVLVGFNVKPYILTHSIVFSKPTSKDGTENDPLFVSKIRKFAEIVQKLCYVVHCSWTFVIRFAALLRHGIENFLPHYFSN